MSPSQPEFLRHILDECSFIMGAVKNKTQEEISSDSTLSRALIRSLEIIGEATKRVGADYKLKYIQIDWREMARMRDKLIHNYFGVDYDIVYNTVKNDIPELHHEIQRIIEIEEG
jgi:uncharacterized protein with HEPN domain